MNRWKCAALAALVMIVSAALVSPPVGAHEGEPIPVVDEFVAGSSGNLEFRQPTALDWLPDGRAIVAGKVGDIYVVDVNTGVVQEYFSIPNTAFEAERGILDILVDRTTSEVFIYRSLLDTSQLVVEKFPFTGNSGADAGSLQRLWANPGPLHSAYGTHHLGGSISFDSNRTHIFISIGDGERPDNSQDLTNVFGKVLRINRTGAVPGDNPFNDGAGPNIDEIWAYGLRNPFRMSTDGTGTVWLGDVGGNDHPTAYEEIHRLVRGGNYGWPLCQGPNQGPKNGPECPAGIVAPVFTWAHPENPEFPFLGSAVAAGEILTGGNLPGEMEGSFLYADYAVGEIRFLALNQDGSVHSDNELFSAYLERFPVWVGRGPDGHIYYIDFQFDFTASSIRRLRLPGAGSGATIRSVSASPSNGPAPLDVRFTADVLASNPVTYLWDFGDGTSSTETAPLKRYSQQGSYTAQLSVTSDGVVTRSEPINVSVGSAPVPAVSGAPRTFRAGDTISLSGSSTGGTAPVQLLWTLVFDHDDHSHPLVTEQSGTTFSYTVPTTGHDYQSRTGLRVILTARDSLGLQSSREVAIDPEKVNLTVTSNVPNATFRLDGETRVTPAVIDTLVGFHHRLDGPANPGGLPPHVGWSNTVDNSQVFVVSPQDASLEIRFDTGDFVANATTMEELLAASDYDVRDAEVLRLYRAVFDREPDISGSRYWIGVRDSGSTLDSIAWLFANSQEFQNTYGTAVSNSAFLDLVYANVLDRQPDAAGKAYWTDAMNRGLSRGSVVRWFAAGREFINEYPYGFPAG